MQVWKQGRVREIPLMQGREYRLLLMLSLIIPVLVNRCAPLCLIVGSALLLQSWIEDGQCRRY
jgi:hypothetical protein